MNGGDGNGLNTDKGRGRVIKSPYWLEPLISLLYFYCGLGYIRTRPKSRNKLHEYWKEPWDGKNIPEDYFEGEERSRFLVELVKGQVDLNARILEIGCNVGRNLHYLFKAGFAKLEGIEINKNAIELLEQFYPEMARHTKIYNEPVEDIIGHFEDNAFDIFQLFAIQFIPQFPTESVLLFHSFAQ